MTANVDLTSITDEQRADIARVLTYLRQNPGAGEDINRARAYLATNYEPEQVVAVEAWADSVTLRPLETYMDVIRAERDAAEGA